MRSELPKTAVGKIDKVALKAEAERVFAAS